MEINIDDYKALNLNRDPFSTAPDPEFLYQSRQHFGTLQLLESSIRKEEGMCAVLGDAGTGKTTICRQLYRKVAFEKNVTSKILYAHYYENSDVLLAEIAELFDFHGLHRPDSLYELLVNQFRANQKTIALIIDNGQLIPEFCLNVLNRLSDLDCDGRRFFQVIVFASKDLSLNIEANPDFESRIVHYRTLGPFNFRDTRQMIIHRLKMAGHLPGLNNQSKRRSFFSFPAMLAIYLATEGYPRKIVMLCHRCLVSMMLKRSLKAGWFLVRASAKRVIGQRRFAPEALISAGMIVVPLAFVGILLLALTKNDLTRMIRSPDTQVRSEITETTNDMRSVSEIKTPRNQDGYIAPETYVSDSVTSSPERLMIEETKTDKNEPAIVTDNEPLDTEELKAENDSVQAEPVTVPEIIGTVTVRRADTLLVMLERVYGHSRGRFRESVVKANTHIANINALEIGDRIHFPPIKVTFAAPEKPHYWIRVAALNDLDSAVSFFRRWKSDSHRIKIIPYFSEADGMHFDVILRESFTDKATAIQLTESDDYLAGTETEVVSLLFTRTTYYANPF